MVSDFSKIMNLVNQNTLKMQQSAQTAIETSSKGKTYIAELNEKSAQTVHITNVLAENIDDVQSRSEDIGSIVDTINAIAEQTNLLSLNASIEAARAGEHGRGFSVVAEEIRKLADQSMQAGNQIKEIVDNIQNTTVVTTESAKEAEVLMHDQVENIESTVTNQLEEVRRFADEIDTLSRQAGELENSMQKFEL